MQLRHVQREGCAKALRAIKIRDAFARMASAISGTESKIRKSNCPSGSQSRSSEVISRVAFTPRMTPPEPVAVERRDRDMMIFSLYFCDETGLYPSAYAAETEDECSEVPVYLAAVGALTDYMNSASACLVLTNQQVLSRSLP
jgi:hypothetical protein